MNNTERLVYDSWIESIRYYKHGTMRKELEERLTGLPIPRLEGHITNSTMCVMSTEDGENGKPLLAPMTLPLEPFVSEKNCVIMPIYADVLRMKDIIGKAHHPMEVHRNCSGMVMELFDFDKYKRPIGYFGATNYDSTLYTAMAICQPEDYARYNPLISQFILNYKLYEMGCLFDRSDTKDRKISQHKSAIDATFLEFTSEIDRDGISYLFSYRSNNLLRQYYKFLRKCATYYHDNGEFFREHIQTKGETDEEQ